MEDDPYELKLYQMFQSCDLEQKGYLNEESLKRLCSLLELRDKGAILIKTLPSDEVSFENFKEALLSFLGSELEKVEQQQQDGSNGTTGGDLIEGKFFITYFLNALFSIPISYNE